MLSVCQLAMMIASSSGVCCAESGVVVVVVVVVVEKWLWSLPKSYLDKQVIRPTFTGGGSTRERDPGTGMGYFSSTGGGVVKRVYDIPLNTNNRQ